RRLGAGIEERRGEREAQRDQKRGGERRAPSRSRAARERQPDEERNERAPYHREYHEAGPRPRERESRAGDRRTQRRPRDGSEPLVFRDDERGRRAHTVVDRHERAADRVPREDLIAKHAQNRDFSSER